MASGGENRNEDKKTVSVCRAAAWQWIKLSLLGFVAQKRLEARGAESSSGNSGTRWAQDRKVPPTREAMGQQEGFY